MRTATRSRFQKATKRRVQALTPEAFAEWRRLIEEIKWATYGKEVATLTVWGEEWERHRQGLGSTDWYWPYGGDQQRDNLDAAYNYMLDPDARLEVWDEDQRAMVTIEVTA